MQDKKISKLYCDMERQLKRYIKQQEFTINTINGNNVVEYLGVLQEENMLLIGAFTACKGMLYKLTQKQQYKINKLIGLIKSNEERLNVKLESIDEELDEDVHSLVEKYAYDEETESNLSSD